MRFFDKFSLLNYVNLNFYTRFIVNSAEVESEPIKHDKAVAITRIYLNENI